ncbi:MAG: hypothetical protein IPI27_18125 [Betaproteobacteria bacterium]|nr:hypothetical protein [Betaproteobacteria bacterium]
MPDPVWGQTVAAAVVGGEVPPEEAALAAHLAVQLAPYKRPRQVCYVPELPLTSAGKPDRAALASSLPDCVPAIRVATADFPAAADAHAGRRVGRRAPPQPAPWQNRRGRLRPASGAAGNARPREDAA